MARRVVTGRDVTGRSVFVSDEELAPKALSFAPTSAYYEIWGVDGPCLLPSDGSKPECSAWFPPAPGFRYLVAQFPPDSMSAPNDLDPEVVGAEMELKFPGAASYSEPDNPGMHTTPTVDVGAVLSGEIWLELDDGAEICLSQGDFVVQNGTRHAWRNKSDRMCTMAFVLIGAQGP